MEFENLGDWCKWLEKNFSNEIMIPKSKSDTINSLRKLESILEEDDGGN